MANKADFCNQHAPVFISANALESTGYMLVSGNQDLVKTSEPQLSAIIGKLINFCEQAGKAAAMKLTGNLSWWPFTAGGLLIHFLCTCTKYFR